MLAHPRTCLTLVATGIGVIAAAIIKALIEVALW